MNSEIIIPESISYCVQDNCPKASQCVRHILYVSNTQDKPSIKILNPRLTPFTAEGCPHFSEYRTSRYACGFRNLYKAIPIEHAKRFCDRIPGITSESMYYRMKRGDILIPPSQQRQILAAARSLGAPESVDFDAFRDVLEI